MARMWLMIILGICLLVISLAGCAKKDDDKPAAVGASGTTGTVTIVGEGS